MPPNDGFTPKHPDIKDKIVVITGATSGIGQVAAENLARRGARIIQVARDRALGGVALQRLRELRRIENKPCIMPTFPGFAR